MPGMLESSPQKSTPRHFWVHQSLGLQVFQHGITGREMLPKNSTYCGRSLDDTLACKAAPGRPMDFLGSTQNLQIPGGSCYSQLLPHSQLLMVPFQSMGPGSQALPFEHRFSALTNPTQMLDYSWDEEGTDFRWAAEVAWLCRNINAKFFHQWKRAWGRV